MTGEVALMLLVTAPGLCAGALALLPDGRAVHVARAASGAILVGALWMAWRLSPAIAAPQMLGYWGPGPLSGSSLTLALDGVAVFPLLAIAVGVFLATWRVAGPPRQQQMSLAILMGAETLGFAAVATQDALVFALCAESLLLPLCLIGFSARVDFRGKEKDKGNGALFVAAFVSTFCTLFAVLWSGSRVHAVGGVWTFEFRVLHHLSLPLREQKWLVGFLVMALVAKAPLLPFQLKLTRADHDPQKGTWALCLIACVLGVYGFVRMALPMAPLGLYEFAPALAWLALATVALGLGRALFDPEPLARSAPWLGVIGLCVLGVLTVNPAGLQGALYGLVALAVVCAAGYGAPDGNRRWPTIAVSAFAPATVGFSALFVLLTGVLSAQVEWDVRAMPGNQMFWSPVGTGLIALALVVALAIVLVTRRARRDVALSGADATVSMAASRYAGLCLVSCALFFGIAAHPLLSRSEAAINHCLKQFHDGLAYRYQRPGQGAHFFPPLRPREIANDFGGKAGN